MICVIMTVSPIGVPPLSEAHRQALRMPDCCPGVSTFFMQRLRDGVATNVTLSYGME